MDYPSLVTKLLWLNYIQIVLLVIVGFGALHWRGQWIKEQWKNKHLRQWFKDEKNDPVV